MSEFKFYLDVLSKGRSQLKQLLESHSDEALVKIPEGYNNNLLWNIGHVIVTQHLLIYKLQGIPLKLDDAFVESFRKGSSPDAKSELQWKALIEHELVHAIEDLKSFLSTHSAIPIDYPTSFGVTLKTIEDALQFLLMHEGLHIGFSKSLAKRL